MTSPRASYKADPAETGLCASADLVDCRYAWFRLGICLLMMTLGDLGVWPVTVSVFTMLGMATGGWMSGKVFDLTGSYHAAFLNGVAWNLLNVGIVVFLLRSRWRTE